MATEENSWKQFPENLGAWDESPPPQLWSQLEAMLDAPAPKGKVRKFRPGWWGLGILLLVIPVGYFLLSGPDPDPKNNSVLADAQPIPAVVDTLPASLPDPEDQPLVADANPIVTPSIDDQPPVYVPPVGQQMTLGNQPLLNPDIYRTNIDPLVPVQIQWNDSTVPRTRQESLQYYSYAPFPDVNANQQVVSRAFNAVYQNGNWSDQQAPLLQNYQNQMSYTPRTALNPSTTTTVSDLNWLLGSWKRMGPSGAAFEEWTRVDKYTLNGRGFFVINGDTTITDRMQIREMPDGLYYIVAVDTNRQSHKYRLRHTGPGNAVFQTESNDNEYRIEFLAPNDQELNVTRNRHHGPGLGTETQKMSREGPAVDAYGEPPKKGGKTKKGN